MSRALSPERCSRASEGYMPPTEAHFSRRNRRLPLSLQSKILRFLEQGEVQRLGGLDNLKVDVRVVAATNADLSKLISQQRFREDLYYRLSIFPITCLHCASE